MLSLLNNSNILVLIHALLEDSNIQRHLESLSTCSELA